jgi:hypothetical protein
MGQLLRFRIMLLMLGLAVLILFHTLPPPVPDHPPRPSPPDAFLSRSPNAFRLGPEAPPARLIPLNAPRELDGKTRREVLKLRKDEAVRHSGLIQGDYVPYGEPFWQIVDRKPWWGIEGQFCRGQGMRSIEGPSEETRFLLNPFLLLGVDEFKVFSLADQHCEPAYPQPVRLLWDARNARAEVTYDMTGFFALRSRLSEEYGDYHVLSFSTTNYNARDFGYQYVTAVPGASVNAGPVEGSKLFSAAVPLLGMIHLGGSCRYPGGCNNASPNEPDLEFRILKLPAVVHLKLWKQRPASPESPADFTYILLLK